jgi:translation initiation factor IF-1
MKKEDAFEVKGVIKKALGSGQFSVEATLENKIIQIRATLSGKVRLNRIKVTEGDKVTVRMTPYDLKAGIIVFRDKA